MFQREIVIDARGHLLGRLASYVAEQLLNGSNIVIQGKGLLLFVVKESTLLAHSSGTKLSSQSFSEKDS